MNDPIRVLQVVTHMNRGGLETMLMNYYRQIDRERVQFDFLTHRPDDGDYGKEIKSLGGKIYHLPMLNPFSASYKRQLTQFFAQHPEYKIVHVHQDCLSGVILKAAMQQGVPVRIAHSHNSNQDKNLKYLIKRYYMKSIPTYATDLFACSKEAGEWMFSSADFKILNNAIHTSDYAYSPLKRERVRSEFGLAQNELVVGHIGRFSPQKNHAFLIDIFQQIKQIEPTAKLMLVGNNQGEGAEKIKEKVTSLGLENSVIFTGLRTDVPDMLQAMDIFVFPSLYEGLGIVAIEAQASGLPCLISDKVPLECKKTDLVQQIKLLESPEVWARAVINAAKETVRTDTSKQIKAAGYDIAENAVRLMKYYLKEDSAWN